MENFRASAPPFVVKHDLFKLKIYLENNKSTGKEVKQECLSLYWHMQFTYLTKKVNVPYTFNKNHV